MVVILWNKVRQLVNCEFDSRKTMVYLGYYDPYGMSPYYYGMYYGGYGGRGYRGRGRLNL
jgi:hypothetical protein